LKDHWIRHTRVWSLNRPVSQELLWTIFFMGGMRNSWVYFMWYFIDAAAAAAFSTI